MKKLLALVLALVMTLSLCTISNAAFTDAKDIDASYEEAVAVLNGMGVFKGYEDGSFKPEGSITRAEVAAIIYRIYTADVKDKQAGLYAGYGKFDDMAGAAWATGYVGFCANAAFVKGYGDGKFGPSDPVTGYQALAMILRAMGYDQNGEFEGVDWELHVAQIAQQLGILDNVKGESLKTAATRELVAELLFQAVQQKVVSYTAAFGYRKTQESLGEKNFGLTKVDDAADIWGRPAYAWTNGKTGSKEVVYATIKAEADATYNTAVTECQIAADCGLKKNTTFSGIFNGVESPAQYEVQPTDTVGYIGAQGEQLEVYVNYDGEGSNLLVFVDTYLAKVVDVYAEKADKAGHVTREAYAKVYAYGYNNNNDEYIYVPGTDLEEDDMILVSVNYEETVSIIGGPTDVEVVEVIGDAASLVGAGTHWTSWDRELHCYTSTVEGKDYPGAYNWDLNDWATHKQNYTWYFDQFGNIIGCEAIANVYTYGIVKDIQWINPTAAKGYAQATIVYMDGTEESKIVDKIDGTAVEYAVNAASITEISTTLQNNAPFCGVDLYQIMTDNSGSVELAEVGVANDDWTDFSGNHNDNELYPADVENGVSAISDGTDTIYTNSDTVYLVKTVKSDKTTYASVKGFENIGDYTGTDVVVDFVLNAAGTYAKYVYITGTADSTYAAGVFFPTSEVGRYDIKDDVFYVKGYLNGEETTIAVEPGTDTDDLVDMYDGEVAQYVMFYVEMTDDVIVDADAYANGDPSGASAGTAYANKYVYVMDHTASVDANVIANSYNNDHFNITKATKVFGTLEDLDSKVVYVIAGADLKATAIYAIGDADVEIPSIVVPSTFTGVKWVVNFYDSLGKTITDTLSKTQTLDAGNYVYGVDYTADSILSYVGASDSAWTASYCTPVAVVTADHTTTVILNVYPVQ